MERHAPRYRERARQCFIRQPPLQRLREGAEVVAPCRATHARHTTQEPYGPAPRVPSPGTGTPPSGAPRSRGGRRSPVPSPRHKPPEGNPDRPSSTFATPENGEIGYGSAYVARIFLVTRRIRAKVTHHHPTQVRKFPQCNSKTTQKPTMCPQTHMQKTLPKSPNSQ